MAHKVHPKSFRIKETADWNSRWLIKKDFKGFLKEDFEIRKYLKKRLKDASLQSIEVERFPGRVNIILNTARPGLIIGRAGQEVEQLKKALEKKISSIQKKEVRIEIREIKDPWTQASLVAQWIAQRLEKRMPYRRTLKQALDKVMAHKEVKGARLEVAGRLNGIEIARTEWVKRGRLPRQTLRADIDFIQTTAYCPYGAVGVKVWIYKGEKF